MIFGSPCSNSPTPFLHLSCCRHVLSRYIVQKDLLGPVFDIFMQNGSRNNMINSVVLAWLAVCSEKCIIAHQYIGETCHSKKAGQHWQEQTFHKLMSAIEACWYKLKMPKPSNLHSLSVVLLV